MICFSFFKFCLFVIQATIGLHTPDDLVIFASLGEGVTLPCAIPSIKSCSYVNWKASDGRGMLKSYPTTLVKAGLVALQSEDQSRIKMRGNCFLHIDNVEIGDAREYLCENVEFTSTVSLEILQITKNIDSELHCSLNTYTGLTSCNHGGIQIKWLNEANTELNGERFEVINSSSCLSKLKIALKPTDHHRKWRCQLSQRNTVKATVTYTTTVSGGVEEVFSVAGESVSLLCVNTSLHTSAGRQQQWHLRRMPLLLDDITNGEGHHRSNQDSPLVISRAGAHDSGEYQCSASGQANYTIRLHILDIKQEHSGPNLTLTCILTCPVKCEADVSLNWIGSSQNSSQTDFTVENNTLVSKLFLKNRREETTCSVTREGVQTVERTWHCIHSINAVAWIALPLGLSLCAVSVGLYAWVRLRKQDSGDEFSDIGMTHVYDEIQEIQHDELQQQSQPISERCVKSVQCVTTINSGCYDLLQAVK